MAVRRLCVIKPPARRFGAAARWLVPVVLLGAVSACATPDVSSFALQTAEFAAAVERDQGAYSLKFGEVILLGEEASSGQDVQAFQERKKKFDDSNQVLSQALRQAVVYSERLAELAEAGETGAQAADSLLGTLKGFASLAGYPGIAVSNTVVQLARELSQAVTRLQAQQRLSDAVAAAQPAVDLVARVIRTLYEEVQWSYAADLGSAQVRLFKESIGADLPNHYIRLKRQREALYARLIGKIGQGGEFCVNGPNQSNPKCLTQEEAGNVQTLNAMLSSLEPGYERYSRVKAEVGRWRLERDQKKNLVLAAVDAWSQEHWKVGQALAQCGGWNAFQGKCAVLHANELRMFIQMLQNELQPTR